jgi:hypothetical protein
MWEIFEDKQLAKLLAQSAPLEVVKRYESGKTWFVFQGHLDCGQYEVFVMERVSIVPFGHSVAGYLSGKGGGILCLC